jgi:hypothetical protein
MAQCLCCKSVEAGAPVSRRIAGSLVRSREIASSDRTAVPLGPSQALWKQSAPSTLRCPRYSTVKTNLHYPIGNGIGASPPSKPERRKTACGVEVACRMASGGTVPNRWCKLVSDGVASPRGGASRHY